MGHKRQDGGDHGTDLTFCPRLPERGSGEQVVREQISNMDENDELHTLHFFCS